MSTFFYDLSAKVDPLANRLDSGIAVNEKARALTGGSFQGAHFARSGARKKRGISALCDLQWRCQLLSRSTSLLQSSLFLDLPLVGCPHLKRRRTLPPLRRLPAFFRTVQRLFRSLRFLGKSRTGTFS
jgi:hypothetical protein